MKVDLGSCALCGAKNSKFVESCYKCGAKLPWAPGFVPPKAPEPPAKSPTNPAPASTPSPNTLPQAVTPPVNEARTIVSPPLDINSLGDEKVPFGDTVVDRASRRVPVPTWAIGAGVLGCVALGMALMMAFGGRTSTPATPAPAPLSPMSPTTEGTPAPITPSPNASATAVPDTAAMPGSTPAATGGASVAPAVTVVAPTAAPTLAPPVVAAPTAAPEPTSAVTSGIAPATAVGPGPTFDALYLNTNTGTKEQKSAYWRTVHNTKVSWRGDFVSLGTATDGPLKIRCGAGANSALVTILLDTNPPQTLPPMQPKQSIAVRGILSDYSAQGYDLSLGQVN